MNVVMGRMLGFYQYKSYKFRQYLHTAPLYDKVFSNVFFNFLILFVVYVFPEDMALCHEHRLERYGHGGVTSKTWSMRETVPKQLLITGAKSTNLSSQQAEAC